MTSRPNTFTGRGKVMKQNVAETFQLFPVGRVQEAERGGETSLEAEEEGGVCGLFFMGGHQAFL